MAWFMILVQSQKNDLLHGVEERLAIRLSMLECAN